MSAAMPGCGLSYVRRASKQACRFNSFLNGHSFVRAISASDPACSQFPGVPAFILFAVKSRRRFIAADGCKREEERLGLVAFLSDTFYRSTDCFSSFANHFPRL